MDAQPIAHPQPVLTPPRTGADDLGVHLERVRAHRSELHESVRAVEAALGAAEPHGGRWRERVRAALAELSHDLDDHVALSEGPGGTYERLTAAAPRLSTRAARLRAEHHQLTATLAGYLVVLEHAGTMADLPAFREEVSGLVARLVRHRHRGDALLHEAYDVDLGGSD